MKIDLNEKYSGFNNWVHIKQDTAQYSYKNITLTEPSQSQTETQSYIPVKLEAKLKSILTSYEDMKIISYEKTQASKTKPT